MNLENAFPKCVQICKKYGKLFRLCLGEELFVIIANARDAEVVLSSTKHIDKGITNKFLHRWLGTGLLNSSGEKWHTRRKIITPTFHFRILENFINIFDKNGDILVTKFRKNVEKQCFDVCHFIDLYTQDIICESAMGVVLNAQLQEEQVSDYLSAVKREHEVIVKRLAMPWLYMDTTFDLSPLGRKSKTNLTILHGMTNKVIKQRRNVLENEKIHNENFSNDMGSKRRFAFLDLLLLSAENGKDLSDTDIREEVDTFMFEGHDTTSSALCFALYELSRNRDIQEQIYDELVAVFHDDLSISLESLSELKYMEMVIKEVLRLYPMVPVFGRTTREDLKLATSNVVIPPGTQVYVTPYFIHRDPEFYPDPEEFNPDNFLPDAVKDRHPFAFVPFSAGPRNCIGQRFAMLEMKTTIAKIVWNFIIERSPTYTPDMVSGITMKTKNGIEIKIASRKK